MRGVLDLLLAAFCIGKQHVVGHLHDQRGDALAEFLGEFFPRGVGVLGGVMQPAGRTSSASGAVGNFGEDAGDFRKVIDVGFITARLPRYAVMPARGEVGGRGDEVGWPSEHCVTACP